MVTLECYLQGTVFVSFSSFTSTLKLKTHSQLTQSPFTGTDCLLLTFYIPAIIIIIAIVIEPLQCVKNDVTPK